MITKRRAKKHRPELTVYLHDEAPRLGCGWRGIKITKRGHKWVRFTEVSTGYSAKLPMREFVEIERRAR